MRLSIVDEPIESGLGTGKGVACPALGLLIVRDRLSAGRQGAPHSRSPQIDRTHHAILSVRHVHGEEWGDGLLHPF